MQIRSRIQSPGFSKQQERVRLKSRPMRSEWKPTPKEERPPVEIKPLAKAPNYGGGVSGVAVEKVQHADPRGEQAHKDALATLGCMVCRRLFPFLAPGPVELHHLRGGGWGKGDYTTLIPLCVEHHRGDSGVHGLGTKGFPKRYGFDQADLLMDALTLVAAPSAPMSAVAGEN